MSSVRDQIQSLADRRVKVEMFLGPETCENATLKSKVMELGSYNSLAQHDD